MIGIGGRAGAAEARRTGRRRQKSTRSARDSLDFSDGKSDNALCTFPLAYTYGISIAPTTMMMMMMPPKFGLTLGMMYCCCCWCCYTKVMVDELVQLFFVQHSTSRSWVAKFQVQGKTATLKRGTEGREGNDVITCD